MNEATMEAAAAVVKAAEALAEAKTAPARKAAQAALDAAQAVLADLMAQAEAEAQEKARATRKAEAEAARKARMARKAAELAAADPEAAAAREAALASGCLVNVPADPEAAFVADALALFLAVDGTPLFKGIDYRVAAGMARRALGLGMDHTVNALDAEALALAAEGGILDPVRVALAGEVAAARKADALAPAVENSLTRLRAMRAARMDAARKAAEAVGK